MQLYFYTTYLARRIAYSLPCIKRIICVYSPPCIKRVICGLVLKKMASGGFKDAENESPVETEEQCPPENMLYHVCKMAMMLINETGQLGWLLSSLLLCSTIICSPLFYEYLLSSTICVSPLLSSPLLSSPVLSSLLYSTLRVSVLL